MQARMQYAMLMLIISFYPSHLQPKSFTYNRLVEDTFSN